MINKLLSKLDEVERSVELLIRLLLFFLFLICVRVGYLIPSGSFSELTALLAPTITLLSAILVAFGANRLVLSNKQIKEEDRVYEKVQVAHHAIAVVKDMKQRAQYIRHAVVDGKKPVVVVVEIAKTIEARYDSLYEKELYKHLPGRCIDIIVDLSGSIYGLSVFSAGLQDMSQSNHWLKFSDLPVVRNSPPLEGLKNLEENLEKLLSELFKFRESLNS